MHTFASAAEMAVDLDLIRGDELFGSYTIIDFTVKVLGSTFIEIQPEKLNSVTLDGEPLNPDSIQENRFPLIGLHPGRHELRLTADMRYSRTGEGMRRFISTALSTIPTEAFSTRPSATPNDLNRSAPRAPSAARATPTTMPPPNRSTAFTRRNSSTSTAAGRTRRT
jgi:hypothetical protein